MPKSYYPPATMKNSLSIARTIYDKGGGIPMFRITIAAELGLKSEGDSFRGMITASNQYGLTSGSNASEKIELEELGVAVLKNDVDAIFEALFKPELFKEFYSAYGSNGSGSIPSEKAATDYLKNSHGVPDRQVKSVLSNIFQNARDWYVIQEMGGSQKFVPVELAKNRLAKELGITSTGPSPEPKSVEVTAKPGGTTSVEILPQEKPVDVVASPKLQLNIEIHISPETSEEKIEAIFKNMRKYLWPNGR